MNFSNLTLSQNVALDPDAEPDQDVAPGQAKNSDQNRALKHLDARDVPLFDFQPSPLGGDENIKKFAMLSQWLSTTSVSSNVFRVPR